MDKHALRVRIVLLTIQGDMPEALSSGIFTQTSA